MTRVKSLAWIALAASFSLVLPTQVMALDTRTIDIVEITWNSASKPANSVTDVQTSITTKVSQNWKSFTTNEGDNRSRTIEFVYGRTLETPIRLSTPLVCEGSGFVSFMREIQAETYRRLGIENWRERYLVILAPSAGCIWMGRAGIGSAEAKGGVLMLHNTSSAYVITHELGHTLGLGHSNLISCAAGKSDGLWSKECKAIEYGGTIDVMGNVETTSTLSTYHQWRMGLLDTSEIAQSWLNEDIELSATDVISGKRAIFLRDGKSTYWIEYRRPKPNITYKAGLVVYRTDPPPSSAVESPNPADKLEQVTDLGISTDIWMMNFDDYQYSMTGRASGSMSLSLGKAGSIANGSITLTALQSADEKSVRVTVKRTPDVNPPPVPEITDPALWRYPNISIIKEGYDDGESAISGFELNLNGKISAVDSSSIENFVPTYLNPFTPQKTVYLRNLPEGDYSIAIRATDVWGNKSPWSRSVKAYVDRGNPIITNDLRISSINNNETKIVWSGVRDEGIGLCSTILHNLEGFVFARSSEKNSPSFTLTTGSLFTAKTQIFDCLGNGLKGELQVTPTFIDASKSSRTGKWSSAGSNYPSGALKCSGKCSASFSTSGNVSALIGQGSAEILLSSKSIASIASSSSNTIRISPPISLGSRTRIMRITGSNFVLAGLAKLEYQLSPFTSISRGPDILDPSLDDLTQRSLNNLGFRSSDFTDDWTVLPMARGTTLLDPTLDLCGGSFPSESTRMVRRQISVTKVGSPYQFLSTESVRYTSPTAATAAFGELRKSYEACIKNAGGTENGVFVTYAFQDLPPGSASIITMSQSVIVRATLGTGASARQLLAVYQYKGSYFTGMYIVKSGLTPIENTETLRWLEVAATLSKRLAAFV